ncbi:DUF5047 domain-containing protein [Streptomyces coeruleorubidus]|uniref:DUF5047 domain-containing protein n=1 Tax=Streptomyces coeruleorubidus TaxID=116188 RepID=A0A5J6I554_STRC4|nr:DUF5047 domain-containing protein [Streptomyces coeruleorubidus]QEV23945.1 DUF5047 domain-containing protein [Streptomyces coeruleorubidus]GGT85945.1 hypothetical protein GCM10010256_52620 [Streptomyces coeruleorubidus]
MYPVSDRFLKTLAASHRVATQVQLFLTTGEVVDLEHTGGSVIVDRAQAIRRTCSVTVADPSLIPRTPADQLATYGARLRISRGIDYGDGTSELVPLGVFRLDSVDGDVSEGPVTLQGKDLSVIVADDKFTEPYKATGTVVGAVTALIQRSIPTADVISLVTDTPIGSRVFDVEADPWAGAQEIAAAAGAEVYPNADGVFVIAALPNLLTTPPVWAIEATEGGVYISGDRAMTSDSVSNGVLARGENTSENVPPVSYLAVDDDPTSPTYWDGPYGRRPKFISSSAYTTVNACAQAANAELAKSRAPNAGGDISSLPNPALETGDVLRVMHEDASRELHQAAAFTVPLSEGGDFPISTISAKEDA